MSELRAYQPSFTAGELSPALWARVDLAKYAVGLKKARNVFIHPHGGVSNRAGLQFINEVKTSASRVRLIPFQFNTEQSYVLEFGDLYMRVYRDGGLILSGGLPYEIATPFTASEVEALVFAQEADVMYICHVNHAPRKLSRLADDNWSLTAPTFAPSNAAPGSVSATATVGSGSTTYRYKVSSVSSATGEESLPSSEASTTNDLTIAGNKNTVSWAAVSGAERYIVYKEDNGVFGYIGGTSGTSFVDENITADLADTPQTGYNPFLGAGNYPRCLTFMEQRLVFASTLNNPQACWFSQSANYENFGFSRPRKDSDGFEFRIRARQVNEIRGLMPASRGLMVLTSGGEWIVSGGEQGYLSPDQIVIKPQSYRGSSNVQPIVVGNTVLFAQERGGVVRDFSYEFAEDNFTGKDLTILARHLFETKAIKAWAYSQAPYSIIWCVLNDGTMVSLTYIKEHDVWGWTRHETDGAFEDVTVIGEGEEDVAYFVVNRTIGGATKRYIERMHTREFSDVRDAFFVDSGLTYSGSAATSISGLSHLEGETVVALADGNVVRNLTVTSGSITLPFAAAKVHVGLPYDAAITTLDLDLGMMRGLGTVQGRSKTISEVTFRVEKTRGIWLGTSDETRESGKLIEWKQRANEAWSDPIDMYTGDFNMTPIADWTNGGNIVVKQFDPLPMTILAVMPDVTLGR